MTACWGCLPSWWRRSIWGWATSLIAAIRRQIAGVHLPRAWLLFSILAVPIQFDQHWVTMGWAIEGAVMTWIGLRANDQTSRYAGLLVFVIGIIALGPGGRTRICIRCAAHFVPLLNRRALSCAVLVAALAASALFYKTI